MQPAGGACGRVALGVGGPVRGVCVWGVRHRPARVPSGLISTPDMIAWWWWWMEWVGAVWLCGCECVWLRECAQVCVRMLARTCVCVCLSVRERESVCM